jgi:hypothetical protein
MTGTGYRVVVGTLEADELRGRPHPARPRPSIAR